MDNIFIEETNQAIYHEFVSEIIQDFFLNESILYGQSSGGETYFMLDSEGFLFNMICYVKEFITRNFFLEVIEIFKNIPNGILKKKQN